MGSGHAISEREHDTFRIYITHWENTISLQTIINFAKVDKGVGGGKTTIHQKWILWFFSTLPYLGRNIVN